MDTVSVLFRLEELASFPYENRGLAILHISSVCLDVGGGGAEHNPLPPLLSLPYRYVRCTTYISLSRSAIPPPSTSPSSPLQRCCPMGALLNKTWTANEGVPNPTACGFFYNVILRARPFLRGADLTGFTIIPLFYSIYFASATALYIIRYIYI